MKVSKIDDETKVMTIEGVNDRATETVKVESVVVEKDTVENKEEGI